MVKEAPKNIKTRAVYPSLREALTYRWSALNKRQTKEVNPGPVFAALGKFKLYSPEDIDVSPHHTSVRIAIWEYQSQNGHLPNDIAHTSALQSIANSLISAADVNKQVLTKIPEDLIEYAKLFLPSARLNKTFIDRFQPRQHMSSLLSARSLAACLLRTYSRHSVHGRHQLQISLFSMETLEQAR